MPIAQLIIGLSEEEQKVFDKPVDRRLRRRVERQVGMRSEQFEAGQHFFRELVESPLPVQFDERPAFGVTEIRYGTRSSNRTEHGLGTSIGSKRTESTVSDRRHRMKIPWRGTTIFTSSRGTL